MAVGMAEAVARQRARGHAHPALGYVDGLAQRAESGVRHFQALNSGMSGRAPQTQNALLSNGNWRGR
jgi:hypothetical protein